MKRIAAVSSLVFGLAASAGTAGAEPAGRAEVEADDVVRHGFGFRLGGYSFRNTEHPELGEWDDCPMSGIGLFAQRTLNRYFFAEAGFDLYTADDATPTEEMPVPGMDRISGVTTVAAGARIPWRWVSPFVQAGLGVEITRVEMPAHGLEDRAVLPTGFVGIGADLRITRRFALGINVRTNVMAHYEHGPGAHSHDEGGDTADNGMTREYDAAAQGQVFFKYER